MVAKLPDLFANNHQPSALELMQLWVASQRLSNVVGFSAQGTTVLSSAGATTNTLFSQSVNFTKLGPAAESYVLAFVSVGFFWAAGTPATAGFGVGMGNPQGFSVDTDVCKHGGSANGHHDTIYGINKILDIPAGLYTPTLYYRVSGGSITMNNGDSQMMYLVEVPYGG